MDPTLSLIIGDPIMLVCPARKGAARIYSLAVRWTGERFAVSGTIRCNCCAQPPRVLMDAKSHEWVLEVQA
jgi:hypothetical protein